jgi:hypothetical protein
MPAPMDEGHRGSSDTFPQAADVSGSTQQC